MGLISSRPGSFLCSLSLSIATLVGAGCNGSDSSSTDRFSTGLDKSKPIGQLSAQEVSDVCVNLENYIRNFVVSREQQCTIVGVAFTDDPKQCDLMTADCLSGEDSTFECPLAAPQDEACSATGAELDKCFNDQFDDMIEALSSLSCDIAGDQKKLRELSRKIEAIDNTEACVSVQGKCPKLFAESEAGGNFKVLL